MCMYNDVYGWQNKQFLGRGEFTLIFGDYDVKITVPEEGFDTKFLEAGTPVQVGAEFTTLTVNSFVD